MGLILLPNALPYVLLVPVDFEGRSTVIEFTVTDFDLKLAMLRMVTAETFSVNAFSEADLCHAQGVVAAANKAHGNQEIEAEVKAPRKRAKSAARATKRKNK